MGIPSEREELWLLMRIRFQLICTVPLDIIYSCVINHGSNGGPLPRARLTKRQTVINCNWEHGKEHRGGFLAGLYFRWPWCPAGSSSHVTQWCVSKGPACMAARLSAELHLLTASGRSCPYRARTSLSSPIRRADRQTDRQTDTHTQNKYNERQARQLTIFCMLAAMGVTQLRSLLCCVTIRKCSFNPSPGIKKSTQLFRTGRHGNGMQVSVRGARGLAERSVDTVALHNIGTVYIHSRYMW